MVEATAAKKRNKQEETGEEEKTQLNRREFLNLAWLASLGVLVANVGGAVVIFGYPRFKEGEFGGIFTFGSIADLPEKLTSPENFPKVKLWLVNTDEGVQALYKVCPHLGCLYGWNDQEFKFICPCHGSQYEYDGDYISGPAPRSLDKFVLRIEDPDTGEVLAESDETGKPVPLPDNPNAVIRIDTGKRIQGKNHE